MLEITYSILLDSGQLNLVRISKFSVAIKYSWRWRLTFVLNQRSIEISANVIRRILFKKLTGPYDSLRHQLFLDNKIYAKLGRGYGSFVVALKINTCKLRGAPTPAGLAVVQV